MARRLHQTVVDYLVIAISPALIMALVGSLVFFLITVLYQGAYPFRLYWVMACFVFAAVLITRIAIEDGYERALPFGAALAIAIGLAANKFMQVQGTWLDDFSFFINWALIGLIWWCAHKLTWDSTVIDDREDASGEGLLQVAGLERRPQSNAGEGEHRPSGGASDSRPPSGWWERYVESQRRPHAPGVWVIYFSLAALPLFGIGQWFIPAANAGARRAAFLLLCVYVASALSLLVTTSFLGLRRYLRQRRLEMPGTMAGLWLATGAAIIALLLIVAALIPRPAAEYAISQLPFKVGSPETRASRLAPVPREGVKDEKLGPAPEQEEQSDEPNDLTNVTREGAKGEKSASDKGSSSVKGSSKDKGSASAKDSPEKSGTKEDSGRSDEKGQAQQQKSDPEQREQQEASKSREKSSSKDSAKSREPQPLQSPEQPVQSPSLELTGGLDKLLKWLFYAIAISIVIYLLVRYWETVRAAIANFLAELRDFWNSLFGRRKRFATATEMPDFEVPPPPFASFADPFATGIAGRYAPAELVRYSFEAFEAWSREHGCPRQPAQTPHELAKDVAQVHRAIAASARNLAELHARAAYDQRELPAATISQLEELWRVMSASSRIDSQVALGE